MSSLKIIDSAAYKEDLIKAFNLMEITLKKTDYLKNILTERWRAEFKVILDSFLGEKPFSSKTHTIFIEFLHDQLESFSNGESIIEELDRSFDAIFKIIRNHGIKSLREKLGRFDDHDFSNYIGTVYETIIIGRFAEKAYLFEYEPRIGKTTKRAEALIQVGTEMFYIESTVHLPNSITNSENYCRKLREKVDKFTGIQIPFVLFINPDIKNLLPPDLDEGHRMILQDANKSCLSALVMSYYYRANHNKIIINPNANFPLTDKTIEVLHELFPPKIEVFGKNELEAIYDSNR